MRLAAAGLVLVLGGCTTPQGVTIVFLLDSSASSATHRADAIRLIGALSRSLEPDLDHVTVLRMSREVYGLYDGGPRSRNLTAALEEYSRVKPDETGTAYGLGLQRGLEAAVTAGKTGRRSALVVLGDGADEAVKGGGNVQWDRLGTDFARFPGDGRLAFVYVDPEYGDRFSRRLSGVLRDRLKLITPPEAAGDEGVKTLRTMIGR